MLQNACDCGNRESFLGVCVSAVSEVVGEVLFTQGYLYVCPLSVGCFRVLQIATGIEICVRKVIEFILLTQYGRGSLKRSIIKFATSFLILNCVIHLLSRRFLGRAVIAPVGAHAALLGLGYVIVGLLLGRFLKDDPSHVQLVNEMTSQYTDELPTVECTPLIYSGTHTITSVTGSSSFQPETVVAPQPLSETPTAKSASSTDSGTPTITPVDSSSKSHCNNTDGGGGSSFKSAAVVAPQPPSETPTAGPASSTGSVAFTTTPVDSSSKEPDKKSKKRNVLSRCMRFVRNGIGVYQQPILVLAPIFRGQTHNS